MKDLKLFGRENIEHFEVYKGFALWVMFNRLGYRVGYVRVPLKAERWMKEHCPANVRHWPDNIECHGGITFCQPMERPLDVLSPGLVIGFDCAHAGDKPAKEIPGLTMPGHEDTDVARSLEYCIDECHGIIKQLWQAGSEDPIAAVVRDLKYTEQFEEDLKRSEQTVS
jgi:hypothetical protein